MRPLNKGALKKLRHAVETMEEIEPSNSDRRIQYRCTYPDGFTALYNSMPQRPDAEEKRIRRDIATHGGGK